jgi:DNA excision repair protein ERCC-2
MERELDELIIVFDEAHNIEGVARDLATIKLRRERVDAALREVEEDKNSGHIPDVEGAKKDMVKMLESIRVSFNNIKKMDEETGFGGYSTRQIRIRQPNGEGEDIFLKEMDAKCDRLAERAKLAAKMGSSIDVDEALKTGKPSFCSIGIVGRFIQTYLDTKNDVKYYPIGRIETAADKKSTSMCLELHCLVPSDVTKPIMDNAYSVVLMSATLQPFDMISDSLGITKPAAKLVYESSYPIERRITLAAETTAMTAKKRDDPEAIRQIAGTIDEVVDATPGNVLVLFPTMNEAKRYYMMFRAKQNVTKFLDESSNTIEMKDKFFKMGDVKGEKAVLFSYMWGKLTEGVDFKYDRLRSVVVVGVPYKTIDDLNKALEHAYEVLCGEGKGKKYAMTYPAVRRVRQAVGRAVRAPDDFGARILIDERYSPSQKWSWLSVFNEFPAGERSEIKGVKPGTVKAKLDEFFAKQN